MYKAFRIKTEKFDSHDNFFRFVRRIDDGVSASMMTPIRDFSTDILRPYNVTEKVFDGDRARTFWTTRHDRSRTGRGGKTINRKPFQGWEYRFTNHDGIHK